MTQAQTVVGHIYCLIQSIMGRELPAPELFERCSANDTPAWQEFRERYGRLISGTIVKEASIHGVRSPDDAADLEQGFYLKLLDRSGHVLRSFQWQGESSDYRYLKTVARFYVKDRMASRRETISLAEIDVGGEWVEPASQIDLEKINEFARAEFSDRDFLIFRLRFFVGLSARQIATFSSIGLREKGVESVIAKIVARLREHFNRRIGKGGAA